jgi:hypothetical protein
VATHTPIQINTIVAMMIAVKYHVVPRKQSENIGHVIVASLHLLNWLVLRVLVSTSSELSRVNLTDAHGHAQLP